jgi:Gram-negative bacterial TonB protein C-terminal
MTIFARLCLASSIVCWMVPTMSLANPTSTPSQQTTTAPAPDQQQAKPHQPSPNPDASGKYHAGDGVTPPRLLLSVEPDFPEAARTARVHAANCVLAITINTDGNVQDAIVVTSKPSLDDQKLHAVATAIQASCIKTVQQYRFKAATFQGKPVPFDMKIEVLIDAF